MHQAVDFAFGYLPLESELRTFHWCICLEKQIYWSSILIEQGSIGLALSILKENHRNGSQTCASSKKLCNVVAQLFHEAEELNNTVYHQRLLKEFPTIDPLSVKDVFIDDL